MSVRPNNLPPVQEMPPIGGYRTVSNLLATKDGFNILCVSYSIDFKSIRFNRSVDHSIRFKSFRFDIQLASLLQTIKLTQSLIKPIQSNPIQSNRWT